jgi:hypothetical protein
MGRPVTSATSAYCPHCEALYHVVKLEVALETVDRQIKCMICDGSLPTGDGKFSLKYFLLRKAARRQKWQRRQGAAG